MAHELMTDRDGKARMLYVESDGMPWHGLGTPLPAAVPATEALRLIGGDFRVDTEKVFLADGREVPDARATVGRNVGDGGPDPIFGVVSDRYVPIQNRDAVSVWDELTDRLSIRTAGMLRRGDTLWLLGELDGFRALFLAGDETKRYVLLANRHDGGGACRAFLTPVRVVCANTLTMAMSGRDKGEGIWIPHKGDVKERIDAARNALGIAVRMYDRLERSADKMARYRPTEEQRDAIMDAVLPLKDSDRQDPTSYTREARNRIAYLADYGRGQRERPEIRGSAWALWNGITDWADHERRGTGPDADKGRRFESAVWGTGARLKMRAYSMLEGMLPESPEVIGAAN